MSSSRQNPIREMDEMLSRFNRALGRGAAPRDAAAQEAMTSADWVPPIDISETATEYLIKIELPEVGKENVKVSVNAGVLLIQGERAFVEEEGRKYHRVERDYGTFARSFTLPEDVEDDKIQAEHREGMLSLHLPKHEQPKPKSIEIKVT